MNNVLKFILIVFIVIIIGLFVEFKINKKKSKMSFLVPDTILVIKGKDIGIDLPVVIYNSRNTNLEQALSKIPKSKRNLYHEQQILPHLSKKITEPFSNSYEELKNDTAGNTPVSFVYKTALGIVDIAHDLAVPQKDEAIYRMLVPKDAKLFAFQDGNNIYLK